MANIPPGAPGEGPEGGGSVPKLVFSLEKALETLAKVVPAASAEIEQVKGLLRQVLMKATQGGGAATPASQSPMTGPAGAGSALTY